MKTKKFTRKDGTEGFEYHPTNGDNVTAVADKVFERENLAVVKGVAKKIMKYGLAVTTKDGNEVFLVVTGGQAKALKKAEPLKGKQIAFANYESPQWGTLLGVKVLK